MAMIDVPSWITVKRGRGPSFLLAHTVVAVTTRTQTICCRCFGV